MFRFATVLSSSLLLLLVIGAAPERALAAEDVTVTVPVYKNTTCPIMGKPASNRLFVDVDGGRIYICCLPCVKKIKDKPAKALAAAYPVAKAAGNKVCPVTGKTLAKGHPFVTLQGYKIGVFDKAAQVKAKQQVQLTLVKALRKGVVDVKNPTCPITGKAVGTNFICLIGSNIVHLSSMRVLTKVRKKPADALAKARASAKKAGVK